MRRMFVAQIIILTSVLLSACGSQPSTPAPTAPAARGAELKVFAASSLSAAFNALGQSFERANPDVAVTFTFAGSQQLAQQIGQGQPADVFASANTKQMETVIASGQVVKGSDQIFARNRLVVVYPKTNPANIKELKDLAKPGIKLVLADKAVPVGGYALDFLNRAALLPTYGATYSQTVLSNVKSYEQDVKAVLNKVMLGEADAGIVYTSDIALDQAEALGRIDIPDDLNTIAVYSIAPIKDSRNAAAKKFVDYIMSSEAQVVLGKYGFAIAGR